MWHSKDTLKAKWTVEISLWNWMSENGLRLADKTKSQILQKTKKEVMENHDLLCPAGARHIK